MKAVSKGKAKLLKGGDNAYRLEIDADTEIQQIQHLIDIAEHSSHTTEPLLEVISVLKAKLNEDDNILRTLIRIICRKDTFVRSSSDNILNAGEEGRRLEGKAQTKKPIPIECSSKIVWKVSDNALTNFVK